VFVFGLILPIYHLFGKHMLTLVNVKCPIIEIQIMSLRCYEVILMTSLAEKNLSGRINILVLLTLQLENFIENVC